MLYSCTCMATVGVKGLNSLSLSLVSYRIVCLRVTQAVSFVNDVTFSLVKTGEYNNTSITMVGSKVHFQMQIAFPVGSTDLLVELFAPDNDTIVMTLCSPNITFVGSNIQYSNTNATPVVEPVINTDYVSHSLISYH